MASSPSLREEVAARSLRGYGVALIYLDKEIYRLQHSGPKSENALMEARLVRAEVLQKMGQLALCESELAQIAVGKLSALSSQGLLLVKAKIAMQKGDIGNSRVALEALQDKLGHDSSTEIARTFLWRQAFTLGLAQNTTESARFADKHAAGIEPDGFQEANNIIFARVLPALAAGDSVTYTWHKWIDDVRRAGRLYLTSDLEFTGRLNNRGKALCQALLAEGFIRWILGNKFGGYRLGFISAILLNYWHLGSNCEGVGELMAALGSKAPELISAIRVVLNLQVGIRAGDALLTASEPLVAEAAYVDAMEIASELLAIDKIGEIYTVLNERS